MNKQKRASKAGSIPSQGAWTKNPRFVLSVGAGTCGDPSKGRGKPLPRVFGSDGARRGRVVSLSNRLLPPGKYSQEGPRSTYPWVENRNLGKIVGKKGKAAGGGSSLRLEILGGRFEAAEGIMPAEQEGETSRKVTLGLPRRGPSGEDQDE